jgi:hypothetical protein
MNHMQPVGENRYSPLEADTTSEASRVSSDAAHARAVVESSSSSQPPDQLRSDVSETQYSYRPPFREAPGTQHGSTMGSIMENGYHNHPPTHQGPFPSPSPYETSTQSAGSGFQPVFGTKSAIATIGSTEPALQPNSSPSKLLAMGTSGEAICEQEPQTVFEFDVAVLELHSLLRTHGIEPSDDLVSDLFRWQMRTKMQGRY